MQDPLPGLASPGPCYVLPGTFERAAVKSATPTWGYHSAKALKGGRYRDDEVRFASRRHMREMLGHFSPGPQYNLPSTIGGGAKNLAVAESRLVATVPPEDHAALRKSALPYTTYWGNTSLSMSSTAPGGTAKLSASDLGAHASFTMTSGSFADPERAGGPPAHSTEYWRTATMITPGERSFGNGGATGGGAWHYAPSQLGASKAQQEIRDACAASWRPQPSKPRRQVLDMRADPPCATVFGSSAAHTDFGVVGGMDREWRESKVQGYTSSAPKMRKPSVGRPLRYAFIQPHGVNSLPKGVDKVHFDGCHAKDGSKSARATLRSTGGSAAERF